MIKTTIGVIAIALTFIGYIPYIRGIILGKTKPHLYSWISWGLTGGIVFALQISNNAGAGAFVTLAAELACALVIFLTIKYQVASKITKTDQAFIFLTLTALGFWLIAKQIVISAILLTLIDLLAFAPTVRKSWFSPHSETLAFYFLNILRFGLAVLALSSYTPVTMLYPLTWFIANTLFVCMLVLRRMTSINNNKHLPIGN
jgi:hypothetical protein